MKLKRLSKKNKKELKTCCLAVMMKELLKLMKNIHLILIKKTMKNYSNKKEKNVYIEADYVIAAIGRLPQKDFYNRKLQVISKLLMKTAY